MMETAERRIEPRHRVGETGSVALDEHTSVGCFVHDVSAGGVRITLPDAAVIPEVFVLSAPCLAADAVCCVVWRGEETIGARFRE